MTQASTTNALKSGRTPFEVWGHTEEWPQILSRAEQIRDRRGKPFTAKIRQFSISDQDIAAMTDKFTNSQLNDTAYMSTLAARYARTLYGEKPHSAEQHVFTSAGQVTGVLRKHWQLESVFGPGSKRNHHGHHAVDAAVIAMSDAGALSQLREYYRDVERGRRDKAETVKPPWDEFPGVVKDSARHRLSISYFRKRKISGALHKETLYGGPIEIRQEGVEPTWLAVIRTPVHELSPTDFAELPETAELPDGRVVLIGVTDERLRNAIRAKLESLGGSGKKEIKKLESDPPVLESRVRSDAGVKGFPIRRVKVRTTHKSALVAIGKGSTLRFAEAGDIYRLDVVIKKTGDLNGKPLSRWHASQKGGLDPKVNVSEGEELFCHMYPGDHVRWSYLGEKNILWVVTGFSKGRPILQRSEVAVERKEQKQGRDYVVRPVSVLFRKGDARVVDITPLGFERVRVSNPWHRDTDE